MEFVQGREATKHGRPTGHLYAPLFVFFLALLYFFPCITVLVKIFSLGAQKHTK
jgi:hypothetical protein